VSIDFRSDNTHAACPEVLDALLGAAKGTMTSYGKDPFTAAVRERCSAVFETDVAVFPVLTGTAGNALGIAAMTPPWGAVFCHEDAHIQRAELGAVEFFTGGAKLIPIAGSEGKLRPDGLARSIEEIANSHRTAVPACLSLTNATEAGTVYSVDETRALCDVARARAVRVHVDGARFANAVVSAGCAPADLSWRAGVDILTLGGTKNGAMAAEVIVVFRTELVAELALRYHRSGHRLSKMRFLSAQFDAYLANDVWLRTARHTNAMASRLAAGISGRVEILRPVDANIVFARFSRARSAALSANGFLFSDWPIFGPDAYRLVTGFSTTAADVDAFVNAVAASSE
jgi:threonine aldolase